MNIAVLFMIVAAALAVCSLPLAWGSADLNAHVAPERAEPYFAVTYQRIVVVEYGEGGELAYLLEGAVGTIETAAQNGGPDAEALRAALNENIKASGSGASIRSLDAHYKATLKGNPIDAVISYEIRLSGTLGGHTITEAASDQPVIVDMAWRDTTVREPVTVQGVEINLPRGAFEALVPEVLAALPDEAAALLDKPLIMATSIHEMPIEAWQSFFGSLGISDVERFEPFEEISGFVVSEYVLGKSGLGEGIKTEIVEEIHFSLDRPYTLRTLESTDTAYVRVLGFAKVESYWGVEVVRVWPTVPEGLWTWFIGDPLQAMIIYGIAGIGAGGGAAFFAFSRRALKRERRMGQRGTGAFPPAGYRAGAGGYAQRGVGYSEPPSPAPSVDAAYPRRAVSPTVASPGVRIWKLGNLGLATGVAAGIAGVIFAVGILLQNPEIFAFGLILTFVLLIAQLVISRVEKGELMRQMGAAVEKGIAAGIEKGIEVVIEQKEDKDLNPSVTDPLERPASRSGNTSRAPVSHREPYGHPQGQTES